MTFFKSHQKLHIWLLADLVLLAAFWIAREHRDWMNALERFVSAPIRRSLGSLCYRVSFSVMEVLYVLAAVLVLAYVVWNITAVVRARGRRKRRAYSAVLGAVCAGLSVCAATCLLWGVCYYTDTFQDRSGIRAEEVSLPDLTAVTAWFAENLAPVSYTHLCRPSPMRPTPKISSTMAPPEPRAYQGALVSIPCASESM